MIFKRTMLVTIPDYRYFKEVLEWDIDSIEDLEERLSDFSEEELQLLYNDGGFGDNIQYIDKIIKSWRMNKNRGLTNLNPPWYN